MSNKLLCNSSSTAPNSKLLTCAAIVLTAINSNYQQPTQAEKKKERDNIEVYLMDHIANKRKFIVLMRKYIICTYDTYLLSLAAYLNNHSASSAYQYEQQNKKRLESDNSSNHNTQIQSRPRGVPMRLRILTLMYLHLKKRHLRRIVYVNHLPIYIVVNHHQYMLME